MGVVEDTKLVNVKHYESLASFPSYPVATDNKVARKRKLSFTTTADQQPKRVKTQSVVGEISTKLLTAVRRRIETLKTSPITSVFKQKGVTARQ